MRSSFPDKLLEVFIFFFILFGLSKLAHCENGTASWYSTEACQFNPNPKCPTASGGSLYELERNGERFAAMWGVPFGTNLRVTNLANGKSTRVTVQDRGPNRRLNRTIDLSKKAFSDIAEIDQGLIPVSVEVLS